MQTLTVISLLMLIAFTAWASGIRGTLREIWQMSSALSDVSADNKKGETAMASP